MNIFAPDRIRAAELDTARILVNVFAGSERSVVSMRVGKECEWIPMNQTARPDPLYASLKARESHIAAQRIGFARSVKELVSKISDCEDRQGISLVRLAKEVDSRASVYQPDIHPMPQPVINSPHLWEAQVPQGLDVGTHMIQVRTVDMFGHVYTGCRAIRIVE
jgi:hypothetical protein